MVSLKSRACEPFRRREIFAPLEQRLQSNKCYKTIKIQACLVLQRRGGIPAFFDCHINAVEYLSAASIALYWKWKEFRHSVKKVSQFNKQLRYVCEKSGDCTLCRHIFLSQAQLDVRLNESEALSIINSCLSIQEDGIDSMYDVHSAIAPHFPEYETVRSNRKLTERAGTDLYNSSNCRPQHFCEPLLIAVEHLRNNTKHPTCSGSRNNFLGRLYHSGIGSALHVTGNDMLVATHLNATYYLSAEEEFNWADERDCKPPTVSCYYSSFGEICDDTEHLDEGEHNLSEESQYQNTFTRTDNVKYVNVRNISEEIETTAIHSDFADKIVGHAADCFRDRTCRESTMHFDYGGDYARKIFARTATTNFLQSKLKPSLLAMLQTEVEEFMASNKTKEFLLSMKNLYAATECDFFVGTRASNWCRLIDEIKRFDGLGGTYYVDAHGHLETSSAYAEW